MRGEIEHSHLEWLNSYLVLNVTLAQMRYASYSNVVWTLLMSVSGCYPCVRDAGDSELILVLLI